MSQKHLWTAVKGEHCGFCKGRFHMGQLTLRTEPHEIIYHLACYDEVLRRTTDCARPGCDNSFIKRKRGRYCSTSCGQKVRTARFRKRLGEKKWSAYRHRLYLQSQIGETQ